MTRALVVKISSLGDVLHTLPAISDAIRANPELRFDWLVEESFREVPSWHAGVDGVIAIATRRWRRQWWRGAVGEMSSLIRRLRTRDYDLVLDAQGLIKSALVTRLARGPRHGLAATSAREPIAALAYQHQHIVTPGRHAVDRLRELFARSLNYPVPQDPPRYGIQPDRLIPPRHTAPDLVFLPGTTWASKQYPTEYWRALLNRAGQAGYRVCLIWGNAQERDLAQALAADADHADVPAALNLSELAGLIRAASAAVAVDSGLSHLAAALGTPCVTVYGATDANLTGSLGNNQVHVRADFPCAPCLRRQCRYRNGSEVTPACYATVPPDLLWDKLMKLLKDQPAQPRGMQ